MNTGLHDSFSRKVYAVVAAIPKGEVLTYKQVAELAGSPRACRAVGNILNKNRDPNVPCHRVIRSDGKIGGFAWGTATKAALLKKEGALQPLRSGQHQMSRQKSGQPQKPTSKVKTPATILDQYFFRRPALKVAQDLLGKYLVRRIGKKTYALKITEVEAYDGPHDLACHASKGRTARTAPMFASGGLFYVYLCYGMHWMLNIVTGPKDYPAAILIRAAVGESMPAWAATDESGLAGAITGESMPAWAAAGESGHAGSATGEIDGPAKLTKFLRINDSLNKKPATPSSGLWFEDRGLRIAKNKIRKSPRIGVAYAGPVWSKKPWRFTALP